MITLKQFYSLFDGKARYTHPAAVAAVVTLFSLLGFWERQAAVSMSVAYWWQEWVRQAWQEKISGRRILWVDHIEQSVYPTLAAAAVYWLFKWIS